jgi:hypothetical protein
MVRSRALAAISAARSGVICFIRDSNPGSIAGRILHERAPPS